MVELVDTGDLKSPAEMHTGSNPVSSTIGGAYDKAERRLTERTDGTRRGEEVVSYRSHNPNVVGSIPTPATRGALTSTLGLCERRPTLINSVIHYRNEGGAVDYTAKESHRGSGKK